MESIHFDKKYREEYKQQFRNMTDVEIEYHIGLEKVRNVIEGFDKDFGIDEIRKLIEEVKNEKLEVKNQKKYCSTCQKNRPIETFEEGFMTCSRCKEKNLKRYHRLREHYVELKKEYRQNHKEEIAEKQKEYFKSIKDVVITCPVCNYEIKKYKKSQHEKSQTHQNNLKNKNE